MSSTPSVWIFSGIAQFRTICKETSPRQHFLDYFQELHLKRKIKNAFEMQVKRYFRNIKNHCQQLRSLQKKEVKSSTTYFLGAFSESKEPRIPFKKVPIIPLRFISEEQITHLQVQSGKQF